MIYPRQTEKANWNPSHRGASFSRLFPIILAGITLISFTGLSGCKSSAARQEWMVVKAPYMDMRTGPGRGYPITHSVLRGERIQILYERTGYFKVRTPENLEGWTEAGPLLDPKSALPTTLDR